MSKKRKVDRKEKKQKESNISTKKGAKYTIKDGVAIRKKTCLKCGPGVFMADHQNRWHCGHCSYTEKKAKE